MLAGNTSTISFQHYSMLVQARLVKRGNKIPCTWKILHMLRHKPWKSQHLPRSSMDFHVVSGFSIINSSLRLDKVHPGQDNNRITRIMHCFYFWASFRSGPHLGLSINVIDFKKYLNRCIQQEICPLLTWKFHFCVYRSCFAYHTTIQSTSGNLLESELL